MDYRIRTMTCADRDEYFEMSRAFYDSGAAHRPIEEKKRESFWEEILLGELVKGYLLEYDGETAGYALAFYYASQEFGGRTLFLDEIFIKEKFRGRGLAKRFFAFFEKNEDPVACRLEVERSNVRAVGLYRSLGYETLDYMQMIKKIR